MHPFARSILLAAGLAAGVAAPTAARAQSTTGTLDVFLNVPTGYTLDETSILVQNPSIGYAGTISFGGGTGPFVVTNLPAGPGYAAIVTSRPLDGGACSGANRNFPVLEGQTAGVVVTLACERAGSGSGPNGNMNLHLGIPAGWTLDQTTIEVQNASIGYSGTVVGGGGAGPLIVSNLPAAIGYSVTISSSGISGVGTAGTCGGTNPNIPIFVDATTITYLPINCARPPGVPALGPYASLLAVGLGLVGSLTARRRRRAQ